MGAETLRQNGYSVVADAGVLTKKRVKSKEKSHFAKLMGSMFKIGLVGFGGGSALIPVIEEEVVQAEKLVSKEAYDEDVISACVTPGALPVEIAAGIGRRAFGARGMLLAALMMALPGALLTVVILSALSGSSAQVLSGIQMLSIGLGAFICSLLAVYAIKTAKEAKKESTKHFSLTLVIMAAVLLLSAEKNIYGILGVEATPLFGLSTIEVLALAFYVILFNGCSLRKSRAAISVAVTVLYLSSVSNSAWITNGYAKLAIFVGMAAMAIGGVVADIRGQRTDTEGASVPKADGKELLRETLIWIAFALICSIPAMVVTKGSFTYMIRGFASSVISFGGGDAYLSVADGMFVSTGFVDTADFYGTLVPVANVLPGSILCKILSGVGYLFGQQFGPAGGYALALSGLAVSVAASGMIFGIVCWMFRTFENVAVFKQISRWIRPIISGLLLNVLLTMLRTNINTGVQLGSSAIAVLILTVALLAVNLYLLLAKKKGSLPVMVFSAVVGLIGIVLL